jgi:putative ABC transport system permease protein
MPLLDGRGFTAQDRAGTPNVVVVDQVLARRVWRGSPLGERLEIQVENFREGYRVERVSAEVVGVVSAVPHDRPDRTTEGTIYVAAGQHPTWSMAIAVRSGLPPDRLMASARSVVGRLDADLPLYDARPMSDLVRSTFALTELALALVAGFAGLALVISAAGLYSLIAYVVRTTAREQAVRMACGASPRRLVGEQLAVSLALAALGIGLGGLLALPSARLMEGLLVGVSASDGLTIAAAAALVLVVAIASTLAAAVGLLRIEPARLLRG